MKPEAAGPPVEEILDAFAERLGDALDQAMADAAAMEARCWRHPLLDVRRALQAWTAEDGSADAARALLDAIGSTATCDTPEWPWPRLVRGALERVDAEVTLAAEELARVGAVGDTRTPLGRALSAFVQAFKEGQRAAVNQALRRATSDVARWVEEAQRWQLALGGPGAGEVSPPDSEAFDAMLAELAGVSGVDALGAELSEALAEAGTLARKVASEPGPSLAQRVWSGWSATQDRALRLIRRAAEAPVVHDGWTEHHAGLHARVDVLDRVLSFHAAAHQAIHECAARLRAEVSGPLTDRLGQAVDRLHAVRSQALAQAEAGLAPEQAAETVRGYLADTADAIERALAGLDAPVFDAVVAREADACVDVTQRLLGRLPVVARVADRGDLPAEGPPRAARTTLTPREWAARALDLSRLTAMRAGVLEVGEASRRGIESARRAPEVLAYNLEAAIDELRAGTDDDGPEGPWALVATGLERTADYLERAARSVEQAVAQAAHIAALEVGEAEARMLERLAEEDALAAEMADAWSDAVRRARDVGGELLRTGDASLRAAGRWAGVAFARARAALDQGRRLIGLSRGEAAPEHTLRELAAVDARAADLPFVYRRLFTPRPPSDPGLFVGRETAIQSVLEHWADWRAGRRTSLAITAMHGSRARSLLDAAIRRTENPGAWRRASLRDRVRSEAELVALLHGALELEGDPPTDLATLEAVIHDGDEVDPVVVERFEHTFLRTVDGFHLAERALEFFSRTDARVPWFLTMAADAWKLLTTVSPTAGSLVRRYTLAELDAQALGQLLLARHQRSGLALDFDRDSVPPAVRRRLGRQGTTIEEAYFERLHELTDGSAPAALLYWVRSATFDADAETVRIRWPDALDFGFLEGATWDQAFALQALAEHGSLTIDDHSRIFSVSSARSFEALESLGNLYLIEPAHADPRVGEQLAFATVEPGVAYRIRPALRPLVLRLLRARHLSH